MAFLEGQIAYIAVLGVSRRRAIASLRRMFSAFLVGVI